MRHMVGMKRTLPHCLLCLLVSLTLALTSAGVAAARVLMAAEAAMTFDVVVCGAGGAHVVTLSQSGMPVAPKAPHHCAMCPDCRLTFVADLPGSPLQPHATRLGSVDLPVLPRHFGLPRAPGPVQARAPPKRNVI